VVHSLSVMIDAVYQPC